MRTYQTAHYAYLLDGFECLIIGREKMKGLPVMSNDRINVNSRHRAGEEWNCSFFCSSIM